MNETRELVIIGAGPAGIRAATTASAAGVDVLLLDQRDAPGGQIYRKVESPILADPSVLGSDYLKGAQLVKQLRTSAVEFRPSSTVWSVTPDLQIAISGGIGARIIKAQRVILATGAVERPFPIPGWTLPGVMSAGGAQSLLKSDGLAPDTPVVLAGSGPLLLLLACQYLSLGVNIAAVLETTPSANRRRAIAQLPGALTAGGYLWKGLGMLRQLRRAGVRHLRGIEGLHAIGDTRLSGVQFTAGGQEQQLDASLLLLHQGVVPDVNLAGSIGCALEWDNSALCFRPQVDLWGNSSIDGIAVVGDGASIVGAQSAALAGELAGLEAACQLEKFDTPVRDQKARTVHREIKRSLRIRPFLETLYRPSDNDRIPQTPDVVVCRCEEVSASKIRDQIYSGVSDPNAIKSRNRCGMGPCQGRYCGLTVCEIIAAETGQHPSAVGYFRLRAPIKPVPIDDILGLATGEAPAEVALPDPLTKLSP